MFNPHALHDMIIHDTAGRHEHLDGLFDLLLSLKSDQPPVYILVMKGFRQIKGDSFGKLYVYHIRRTIRSIIIIILFMSKREYLLGQLFYTMLDTTVPNPPFFFFPFSFYSRKL